MSAKKARWCPRDKQDPKADRIIQGYTPNLPLLFYIYIYFFLLQNFNSPVWSVVHQSCFWGRGSKERPISDVNVTSGRGKNIEACARRSRTGRIIQITGDDEREQRAHTSERGGWGGGCRCYFVLHHNGCRRPRLALRRRICLSSLSSPLSVLPPLRRHTHLFYLPLSPHLTSPRSVLTHSPTYRLDSFYRLFTPLWQSITLPELIKKACLRWVFSIGVSNCGKFFFLSYKTKSTLFETVGIHPLIGEWYRFAITR